MRACQHRATPLGGIRCLAAALLAAGAGAMGDMASSGASSDGGQCMNSLGEDCALARSWFYKPPVYSLADTAAAAVAAMATRATSLQQLGRKHLPGVWSYFSMGARLLAPAGQRSGGQLSSGAQLD